MTVVLWTALPALACAMPASQPACCHGMMQGCDDPSAGMDTMSCCLTSAPGDATPPVAAAPSTHIFVPTDATAWLDHIPASASIASHARRTDTSPSPPGSGLSSILRI
jgi:hypothetical protein